MVIKGIKDHDDGFLERYYSRGEGRAERWGPELRVRVGGSKCLSGGAPVAYMRIIYVSSLGLCLTNNFSF